MIMSMWYWQNEMYKDQADFVFINFLNFPKDPGFFFSCFTALIAIIAFIALKSSNRLIHIWSIDF